MTKPGWNASQPLSREAFNLDPFCEYDGGMVTTAHGRTTQL